MVTQKLRKTPLAWRQLMKQKTRLMVALAGIAFADILMFVQMGLLDSLYDSATQPHRLMQTDLVLVNPQAKTLIDLPSFPRTRLYQVRGYEGVVSVSSLYADLGAWRNPETRLNRDILVFGIDPRQPSFTFLNHSDQQNSDQQDPNLRDTDRHTREGFQELNHLKLLSRGLFDRSSNAKFGPIRQMIQEQDSVTTELNDKRFHVIGLFSMGASFGAEGNVITSTSSFLTLFPERHADKVDIGLVQLQPEIDREHLQAQLQATLPADVKVLTKDEFIQLEKSYWAQGGTGFIFNMGAVVGFIVGTVIVYQILYTDVSDHLPEYATLKAMGYSDRYLTGVLAQEVLVLATLGFIPGFVLSLGLYQLTYSVTALPVVMKIGRAVLVLFLTLVMCSGSGLIALKKLRSADPADIFG